MRAARGRAAGPSARGHDRHRRRQRALEPRRAGPATRRSPATAPARRPTRSPLSFLNTEKVGVVGSRYDIISWVASRAGSGGFRATKMEGCYVEVVGSYPRSSPRGCCVQRHAPMRRHSRSTTTRRTARPPRFTSVQAAVDAAAPATRSPSARATTPRAPARPAPTRSPSPRTSDAQGRRRGLRHHQPEGGPARLRGRILEATPDLRNGVGDIVAIVGTPTQPLTVNISGVTVSGYDPAGPRGRGRGGHRCSSTPRARSTAATSRTSSPPRATTPTSSRAATAARSPASASSRLRNALLAPVDGARKLEIDRTRVDKYNRVGILIDGAQNDFAPFVASGAVNWGVITATQIIGRTQCSNFAGTGTAPPVGRPDHDRPAVRPGRHPRDLAAMPPSTAR